MYSYFLMGFIIALFLVGMFLASKVYKRLKLKHYSVYQSLGSPTLFLNHSIKADFQMTIFLLKRKYLPLKDIKLKKLCDILLIHMIVTWVVIIICFIV